MIKQATKEEKSGAADQGAWALKASGYTIDFRFATHTLFTPHFWTLPLEPIVLIESLLVSGEVPAREFAALTPGRSPAKWMFDSGVFWSLLESSGVFRSDRHEMWLCCRWLFQWSGRPQIRTCRDLRLEREPNLADSNWRHGCASE